MEVRELMQQIKHHNLDTWYIFNVQECATAKIYINKMAECANLELSYVDSIYDIFTMSSQRSLIQTHHLYVIIDDKDFLSDEKAWSAMDRVKDDVVIFYYTNKDGRLKFWKNFQYRAVDFERLNDRMLIKYIQKDIELSEENCRLLIEVCEGDYNRILLEIDKIKRFEFDEETVINNDIAFEYLLKEGAIYREPKDAIFDFISAVLERNANKAWLLLEQSYAVGEANMVILSVLYNYIRNLLILQSSKGKSDLNGWQVKNIIEYKDNYSNGELIRAMHLIRDAETGIKTGRISDNISVEQLLVRIM